MIMSRRRCTRSRSSIPAISMPIWRGTVIGFLIGIIPGSAHVISTFVSYAIERKVSKRPEEFGRGAVAGVAGPESANNAATSGAFVPMLALGVPGVPIAALLLAAMMVHGVSPGPFLIQQNPKLFWGFIASMYVGNVILLVLNLPLVGLFVNLLRVPYPVLYPLILVCSILGVYAVNSSVVDVWIMSFIWDCIALVIPIRPERRDDLRKEVLTPCSSERCQVVRNGGGCKLAWEELLQRPNAHREDVDPDPNVPEVGSSQEKAHLLTIPQRARRNHSLSGVGTYVLRDSLHHGLHIGVVGQAPATRCTGAVHLSAELGASRGPPQHDSDRTEDLVDTALHQRSHPRTGALPGCRLAM